jgi:hypothetical protein
MANAQVKKPKQGKHTHPGITEEPEKVKDREPQNTDRRPDPDETNRTGRQGPK